MKFAKIRHFLAVVALAAGFVFPASSQAALVDINWVGANGYSMTGQFGFSDSLLGTGVIHAGSLTSFSITGFNGASTIGTWNYFVDGLAFGNTFNFNFNTTTLTFGQGGALMGLTGEGWNNTGTISSCATFGFISGSGGQGLCAGGAFLGASRTTSFVLNASLESSSSTSVPEPGSLFLVGLGMLLAGFGFKRRTLPK